MIVGYARVSSTDQSLDLQNEQLTAAGAEKVFGERLSGTSTTDRAALAGMLEWVREGDVVLVTRLDRLGRSVVDLHQILALLAKKNVEFRCLLQPIDSTTAAGRMMLTMLGAFAEFETDIRKERQMEGIAKAKANGVYGRGGVKRQITSDQVLALKSTGLGATEIGRKLGVSKMTVYRATPGLWGEPPAV